jgi:hypothetical protein
MKYVNDDRGGRVVPFWLMSVFCLSGMPAFLAVPNRQRSSFAESGDS